MLFLALALRNRVHDNVLALGEKHCPDFVLLDGESGCTELHFDVVKRVALDLALLLYSDNSWLLNEYGLGGSAIEGHQIFHTRAVTDLRVSEAA